MNRFRQGRRWLVLIPTVALFISSAAAQNATTSAGLLIPSTSAIIPPPILPPSPVDNFRKFLAMSPQQLQIALANKPPKIRARILAKVNEYTALNPDERELRLRATKLRWYLMPILQAPADQRTAQLALVPADIRDLVQSRVTDWVMLPPSLQQEFLDNEHIAGYFAGLNTTNDDSAASAPSDTEQSRWNTYSDTERLAMVNQFNDFFNLSTEEKQKALGELTDLERKQMEATLQTFAKLPGRQRTQCIRAFGQFASMSREERAEFLKDADQWSKMTASERQGWRDLVSHVPQWPAITPPLPPGIIPPSFNPAPQNMRVVATTNHS